MSAPRIVCAAVRRTDGCIVAGPRHFDQTMWCQILGVTPETFRGIQSGGVGREEDLPAVKLWQGAEQGFIDQHGNFYTREEAWRLAERGKQIAFDDDWQRGSLHSEHLY